MAAHLKWRVTDRERLGVGRPVDTNAIPLQLDGDRLWAELPLDQLLPELARVDTVTAAAKKGSQLTIVSQRVVQPDRRSVEVLVETSAATSLGEHVLQIDCGLVNGDIVALNGRFVVSGDAKPIVEVNGMLYEMITATPYQAKDGVRGVVDMDALGSDLEVLEPTPLADNVSFSVWFVNHGRRKVSINCNNIQRAAGPFLAQGPLEIQTRNGIFQWHRFSGKWYLHAQDHLTIPLGIGGAVQWTPQSSNGPCTVIDSYPPLISVERTTTGRYSVTFPVEVLITDQVFLTPQPYVVNLPVDSSAEVNVSSVAGQKVNLETGLRNKNGNWTDDDLTGDPANRIMFLAQQFP